MIFINRPVGLNQTVGLFLAHFKERSDAKIPETVDPKRIKQDD